MSGASEQVNGRASGPVLTSGFLVVLAHSAFLAFFVPFRFFRFFISTSFSPNYLLLRRTWLTAFFTHFLCPRVFLFFFRGARRRRCLQFHRRRCRRHRRHLGFFVHRRSVVTFRRLRRLRRRRRRRLFVISALAFVGFLLAEMKAFVEIGHLRFTNPTVSLTRQFFHRFHDVHLRRQ